MILQRKPGESLVIGENITISVVSVDNGRVRLAIDAPSDISILRSELLAARAANQESAVDAPSTGDLLALLDFMPESAQGKE